MRPISSEVDVKSVRFLLVPAAGVEPATFRSGGERSNPLSYAGMGKEENLAQQRDSVPASVSEVCG